LRANDVVRRAADYRRGQRSLLNVVPNKKALRIMQLLPNARDDCVKPARGLAASSVLSSTRIILDIRKTYRELVGRIRLRARRKIPRNSGQRHSSGGLEA